MMSPILDAQIRSSEQPGRGLNPSSSVVIFPTPLPRSGNVWPPSGTRGALRSSRPIDLRAAAA